MADWEHLPFDLVEELKAKNLHAFVLPALSSCNEITVEVYKNERYRRLAKEWGSIIGVHLFPAVDRRPITNEKGDTYIDRTLEAIEPLKGFKWADDWVVSKEPGVTDADGFLYAHNWQFLRDGGRMTNNHETKMTWVRRQKLRRTMVVDLHSGGRSLPFELVAHVTSTPSSSGALNASHAFYIEFHVDGAVHETGALGPPFWSKDFVVPLTHIARYRKVELHIFKGSSPSQPPIVKAFTVGEIVDELNNATSDHMISGPTFSSILYQRHSTVKVEFRINEHTIFTVGSTDECFAEGQLNQSVMNESKISHRLKEEIIMLSLSLGNSNGCNGLLKEITELRTNGSQFINDFDLINIIKDINQIQATIKTTNNDLNKVISYLRDAERVAQQEALLGTLHYPYTMPLFNKWIPFSHFFGEEDLLNMKPDLVQRIVDNNYYRTRQWFHQQPSSSTLVMQYYHAEWHRESRLLLNSYTYRVYLFTRGHGRADNFCCDEDPAEPLGDDEHGSLGLFWTNIWDYYMLLKHLSTIKYNLINNQADGGRCDSVVMEDVLVSWEGRSFENGVVSIHFDEEQIEVTVSNLHSLPEEDRHLFPINLPFEVVEAIEISHAHSLTMTHLLELKLLSVTSFQLASSATFEHEACIDVDTSDGQHYSSKFSIQHDTNGAGSGNPEPAAGEIGDTVRVLLPYWQVHSPGRNEASDRYSPPPSGKRPCGEAAESCKPFVFLSLSAKPAPTFKTSGFQMDKIGLKREKSGAAPLSPTRRDRDKVDSVPSGLSLQFPPVSDVIMLGRVPVPPLYSSQSLLMEQELQVVMDKPAIELHVDLGQVHWAEERIAAQGWDIYALVFLVDRDGQVVSFSPDPVASPTRTDSGRRSFFGSGRKKSKESSSATASSSQVTGGSGGVLAARSPHHARSGFIRRTGISSQENMYRFEGEGTITVDSTTCAGLDAARYILTEIWGVDPDGGVDIHLGETLVSISTAASMPTEPVQKAGLESDDDDDAAPIGGMEVENLQCIIRAPSTSAAGASLTPPSSARGTASLGPLLTAASSKHLFTLGTLSLRMVVLSSESPSGAPTSSIRHLRNCKGSLVKLATSVRPLQPGDCAWPAQLLSMNTKRLEPELYFFSVLQYGLQITVDVGTMASNPNSVDRIKVLEECKERVSNSAAGQLTLLMPFSRITSSDLHILSEHSLLLCLKFGRQMTAGGKTSTRIIEVNFVVGPCLAEDMHASICNNIGVQETRQALSDHMLSQDKEQEESFHSLAKSLETSIYSTMLLIDQSLEEQRMLLCDSSANLADLAARGQSLVLDPGDGSGHGPAPAPLEMDSCCLSYILGSLVSKKPTIKQLYLRLATFRIYLWYLLEQAPATYSAEKHYLDANWITFDGDGVSPVTSLHGSPRISSRHSSAPIDTTNYANEIDALLYRIGEHMRRLEQEVRHLIYRALHNNHMDVSAQLTRVIFTKYKDIIAMLLDTIDRTDATIDADTAEVDAVGRKNNNPQKKRDLIKFIITHDEVFESYCNYILRSHNYKFNRRPLLSICINFEDLLGTFSSILDSSLLMWNTRTLKHFMDYKYGKAAAAAAAAAGSGSGRHGSVLLPWEITTLLDKSVGKELYISHIPETIQLQLNVEIGLKKIAPLSRGAEGRGVADSVLSSSNITRSMESFQRIEAMNRKIMGSIILSYIALAAEYENILNKYSRNVEQYLQAHQLIQDIRGTAIYSADGGPGAGGAGGRAKGGALLRLGGGPGSAGAQSQSDSAAKDEIIFYLLSIVNDCQRINGTHIPQTVESFLSDYHTIYAHTSNRSQNVFNLYQKNYINKRNAAYLERKSFSRMSGERDSIVSASHTSKLHILSVNGGAPVGVGPSGAGGDSSEEERCQEERQLSFDLCIKVVNTVTYKTLNELSNQLFSFSELRFYFLCAFDDYVHTYKFHGATSCDRPRLASEATAHSPMEVIKATLLDFLTFVGRHLTAEHMFALVYVCIFKLIVRYLLFLRDYHEYRNRITAAGSLAKQSSRLSLDEGSMDKPSTKRISFSFRPRRLNSGGSGGGGGGRGAPMVATEEDLFIMGVWESDLKHLKALFTEVRHTLLPQTERRPRAASRDSGDDASEADDAPLPAVSATAKRFEASCVSLLKKLSFSIMSALTNDWGGSAATHRFLANNFGISPPPRAVSQAAADSDAYYAALDTFFRSDAAFAHFTPLVISDETADNIDVISGFGRENSDAFAPRCHLVISSLACVKVRKYKSIFLRIHVQKQVHELPLQGNSGDVTAWADAVRLDNILVSSLKELRVEVVGFQIRPFKAFRQPLVGSVAIDLADIIRSSQHQPLPSNPSLRGALTEAGSPSLPGRPSLSFSSPMRSSHNAQAIVAAVEEGEGSTLCSHTAWYIIQPSSAYSSLAQKQAKAEAGMSPARAKGKVGVSYIDSLAGAYVASKGPRPDSDQPQLRLQIQVLRA